MKIPDDVFETRCPYCIHGQTRAGNKDIPEAWVFQIYHIKDLSCRVMGIAKYERIPGECETFQPNDIFGICLTCMHFNSYQETTGCVLDDHPNRRCVYVVNSYGKSTYANIGYTCDNFEVKPYLTERMVSEAAAGRIPQNFDPETMEPIGRLEESKGAAEHWEMLTRKARAEEEAARRAREEKNGQQIEFTIDDFEED